MIQIIALHPKGFATLERLFPNLSDEAMNHIETMEADGYLVTINNLPSQLDTPEAYSLMLLDQWSDLYQSENDKFN